MSHHEVGEALPLFQSPLVHHQDTAYRSASHSEDEASAKNEATEETMELQDNDKDLHDNPQFHRHSEATNAELFYDLFFVANLTVFTNVKEVNDHQTLAQYVGFFCILWFTWYQTGLYDVRFSMDSVFERIAKACQFGVMVGFAITGPKFDVGAGADDNDGEGPSLASFKALSLILMASRLVLVFQYLQSFWFTRHFKRAQLPMALIASTYFIAAMIYLGLFFTFHRNEEGGNNTYIAWYVVAGLETIVATTVSCYWRIISFKGTHLVQRMSLLTLIILGEGVMGLSEKCQKIVESEVFKFTPSTIGNIISFVLILYFLYMLYFDWIQEEHFGTIKQQVWAFLHFPLHLFLVLAVEGAAQSVAWRAGIEKTDQLYTQFDAYNFTTVDASGDLIVNDIWLNKTAAEWQEAANAINETAQEILQGALSNAKTYQQTYSLDDALTTIYNGTDVIANGTASTINVAANAAQWIMGTLVVTVIELAGFEGPEDEDSDTNVNFDTDGAFDSIQEGMKKTQHVFSLTFIYFFVSIGLVIMLCTLLAALSKKEKRMVHWVRLAASGFIGFALCLLSIIAVTSGWNSTDYAWTNYTSSPWLLPTAVFALLIVVMLNSVRFPSGTHGMPSLVPMRTRTVKS